MNEQPDGTAVNQKPPINWASSVTAAGFTMIPNAVMLRTHLSSDARLVYGYLKHLAWRADVGEITSARDAIAFDLGLSEKKVTNALRELQNEPVVCGDDTEPPLIICIRPGQGKPNRYLINDPESMPQPVDPTEMLKQRRARQDVANALRCGELERLPCEVCGRTPAQAHHDDYDQPLEVRWLCLEHHREEHGHGGTRRAEKALQEEPFGLFPPSIEESEVQEKNPLKSPTVESAVLASSDDESAEVLEGEIVESVLPLEPPPIGHTDGRNLALDALMEACGWDSRNKQRVKQATTALNGERDRSTKKLLHQGITHLYWAEITDAVAAHPEHLNRAEAFFDTDMGGHRAYAAALAHRICEKADLYRRTMDDARLTPTALRSWWLDLEKQTTLASGRRTTDDDFNRMEF